jgi:hypothetical protein
VGELAHILDRHSLRVEVDPAYEPSTSDYPTSGSEADGLSTYSRISTASLRLQRQANTRRHCSASHVRDLSKLVEKMIEEEDQCSVSEPSSTASSAPSSNADEDEGIDMDYTPANPDEGLLNTLKFRRAGDRVGRATAVMKKVRVRKQARASKSRTI